MYCVSKIQRAEWHIHKNVMEHTAHNTLVNRNQFDGDLASTQSQNHNQKHYNFIYFLFKHQHL